LVAQVVFVASWLVAATWQGPRYSVAAHSISDLYAVTAPHGAVLVVVLMFCGAATMGFALRSVWSALRTGGWRASTGSTLLALSIAGLGDLLSPAERLACRMADPGCTATQQLSNTGGQLDNAISSLGVLLLVIAAFFVAAAMRRARGWEGWARPTRWTAVLIKRGLRGPIRAAGRRPERRRARSARDRNPPTDRDVLTAVAANDSPGDRLDGPKPVDASAQRGAPIPRCR
jgi:hypothetical membrane protein